MESLSSDSLPNDNTQGQKITNSALTSKKQDPRDSAAPWADTVGMSDHKQHLKLGQFTKGPFCNSDHVTRVYR